MLRQTQLDIEPGPFVLIVGRSGGGQSTLQPLGLDWRAPLPNLGSRFRIRACRLETLATRHRVLKIVALREGHVGGAVVCEVLLWAQLLGAQRRCAA